LPLKAYQVARFAAGSSPQSGSHEVAIAKPDGSNRARRCPDDVVVNALNNSGQMLCRSDWELEQRKNGNGEQRRWKKPKHRMRSEPEPQQFDPARAAHGAPLSM
jgi:hypothetical protein